MDFRYKVLDTIKRYDMIKRGDRVVVAVSGGPDSVFLLHVLFANKERLGIKIFVANADHGLRKQASRRDSDSVKKIAKDLGLKIIFKKLNVNKKPKLSLEESARNARYDFLKKAAGKLKANVIATGHTLDDQAETVLMRIIKGASLKGVVGIPPVREDGKVRFIRPLICVSKKEITAFLRTHRIPFRIDATNFEEKFFRNVTRKKIIPYLARYNPRIKRALFNLAESLREDHEFIENEKKRLQYFVKRRKNFYYIDLKNLVRQPKALQREIIREVLKDTGANIKKLTFRHWKDMEDLVNNKPRGKAMDLPGGIRVSKGKEALDFFRL